MKNLVLLILILSISLSFSDTCPVEPEGVEDELDDCKKLTTAKGNYCCLLSYDLGKGEEGIGDACILLTEDEYKDRDKVITKLKQVPDYANAKGKILCDGDKTEDAGFISLKITKGILGLLLIFL